MTDPKPLFTLSRLTREERQLLLQRFPLSAELRAQMESETPHAPELWISVEEADELREAAQELLDLEGFDGHYSPTALGRMLETLIDKLYTG